MGHLPTVLLFDALLIAHFIAAAPAAQAAHLREQGPGQPASPPKRLVLFDHDGGVDDFITLLLVLSCDPADVTVLGDWQHQGRVVSILSSQLSSARDRLAQVGSPCHLGTRRGCSCNYGAARL